MDNRRDKISKYPRNGLDLREYSRISRACRFEDEVVRLVQETGISLADVAHKIGITPRALRRSLDGHTRLTLDRMIDILWCFDRRLDFDIGLNINGLAKRGGVHFVS